MPTAVSSNGGLQILNRSGHVVFVINSLVGGGAERALINVIAGLEGPLRQSRVSLVLLDDLPEKHRVPAFVDKYVLSSREGMVRSLLLLTRQLRALKPDVVVSFLSRANCANVFAAALLGHAAIISERVHTTSHFRGGLGAALNKVLIRLFYGRADRVVAVSSGVERDLAANFGVRQDRIAVINNPIDLSKLQGLSRNSAAACWDKRYVMALGRLVPNKNFAMLLRGFAKSGSSDTLIVLGEGPERGALERLASELGLTDRIAMPGYVDNPYRAIAGARFLVSSSNAEGFPNAIVEAMAVGCPVIATDCESGPADVLSPDEAPRTDAVTLGAYGLLVPVERDDLLAEAIGLYADDERREAYRQKGLLRCESFSPARISERYWQTIAPYLPPADREAPSRPTAERQFPNRAGLA